MFSCRAVGNKEPFSGFLDLLKYVWRDNDTKLCMACCVHGTGGARGGVSGRRDGMAHVCGVCFSFIYLTCFAFCSPQLLCIDGNWRQHLFSLFSSSYPFLLCSGMGIPGCNVPHTCTLLLSMCKESWPGEANHSFGTNNSIWSRLGAIREERTEGTCPMAFAVWGHDCRALLVPQLK